MLPWVGAYFTPWEREEGRMASQEGGDFPGACCCGFLLAWALPSQALIQTPAVGEEAGHTCSRHEGGPLISQKWPCRPHIAAAAAGVEARCCPSRSPRATEPEGREQRLGLRHCGDMRAALHLTRVRTGAWPAGERELVWGYGGNLHS